MSNDDETKGEGCLSTLGHYSAWLITSAGAIIDLLAVRQAILAMLAVFSVISQEAYHARGGVGVDITTQFGITAFDNAMLLILGCVAIGFIIWVEYYFRKGRPLGLLYKRIAKVALIEIAVIVVVVVTIEIAGLVMNKVS